MTHFATLQTDGSRQWKALCDPKRVWSALEKSTETYVKAQLPSLEAEREVFDLINFGGVPQGESDV